MKPSHFIAIAAWFAMVIHGIAGVTIKTVDGKVYENAEVRNVENGKVTLAHSGGVAQVSLSGLSDEVRHQLQLKPTLESAKWEFNHKVNGFKQTLGDLETVYAEHLAKLEKELQAQGLLDQMLAVRKEAAEFRSGADPGEFKFEKLGNLRNIYEKERNKRRNSIVDELKIALDRFQVDLKEVQKELTKASKIDEALLAKNEEDKVVALLADRKQALETLGVFTSSGQATKPAAAAVIAPAADMTNKAQFSREEFAEWIQEQTFEFTGEISGLKRLKFKDGILAYGQYTTYPYEVTGSRTVEIDNKSGKARFTVKFSRDLQSGTFISIQSTYKLEINPPAK